MAIEPAGKMGMVYLVGAGPGDPGLLTLRAVECLGRADLVVHDQLVPAELLSHAPQAKCICLGELTGSHSERHAQAQQMLIDAAHTGQTAVHLKGGDPWIFGRGGEEAEALAAAGIPYEIVPGVTAALAAGACAGIPLTHRELSSTVTLVTGHECPGKAHSVDWAGLARVPGTIAIYMGLARLNTITQTLMAHGKPAETPAAVVHSASLESQRTLIGTLGDIADQVRRAGVTSPVVTLIGPVVGLRQRLAWFERRPLSGRHVLVTRPRPQAGGMIRRFQELGATVHAQPILEIGPPPDPAAIDRALARLSDFQWLVFTSANGVEAFLGKLLQSGRDLRSLGGVRLAAIGAQTAAALKEHHLRPDVVPERFTSEGLAGALVPLVKGQRLLLARADRGREVLVAELSRIAAVEQLALYTQNECRRLSPEVGELLRQGRLDFVTLTSTNIARGFLHLLGPAERAAVGKSIRLVTISPVTSAAVRELGFEVSAEAATYTGEGVVQAVVRLAVT